jgi:deoxyribodipyrimidine photo-lyase
MRELWATGTMHNRVRMVVASFLTKNLLIDWRRGEHGSGTRSSTRTRHPTRSTGSGSLGSGADAAPYFRVFNPELQATKFDPDGEYVRRWVPEVGTRRVPRAIVDLKRTREAALAAYEHCEGGARLGPDRSERFREPVVGVDLVG